MYCKMVLGLVIIFLQVLFLEKHLTVWELLLRTTNPLSLEEGSSWNIPVIALPGSMRALPWGRRREDRTGSAGTFHSTTVIALTLVYLIEVGVLRALSCSWQFCKLY